jgi:hypothetical protein
MLASVGKAIAVVFVAHPPFSPITASVFARALFCNATVLT